MRNVGKESEKLEHLIQSLQSNDLEKWFKAGLKLEGRAGELGEFVEPLRRIALNEQSPARHTAAWLLRELERETSRLWRHKTAHIACTDCGTPFTARTVDLLNSDPIIYYGCTICGQSRNFFEIKEEIFCAVLDNQMAVRYIKRDNVIRINWLLVRGLFDFDQVEIVQAIDEDVERFAVQIGNDTNEQRKASYREMHCIISPDCLLADNTIKILKHLFGRVEVRYYI